MARPPSPVVTHHPFPPLATDLQPLMPLLQRLFSKAPLNTRESFPVGRLLPGTVDVNGHALPPPAMRAIADAALEHGAVKTLNLTRCRLLGPAALPLVEFLRTSPVLERLSLKDNQWTEAEPKVVFGAVEDSPALTSIAVAKETFGVTGGRAAARLLSEQSQLKGLKLDAVALESVGLVAIAHALEVHNRTLTTLSLQQAELDAPAARALSSAITNGGSLRWLSLRDAGGLTDQTISALALGVGDSPQLVGLDLAGHASGAVGITSIADAVGGHSALKHLDLGDGRRHQATLLTERGASALAEAIAEPKSSLASLSVACAGEASAAILLGAVERAGRPVRLHLGPHVRVKTRRKARRLGAAVPSTAFRAFLD